MLPWTTQLNSTLLRTCFASMRSRSVLLRVCFSLALFVAAGSEAITITCWALYDSVSSHDVCLKFVDSSVSVGSVESVTSLFGLTGYNYADYNHQYYEFWPKGYSRSSSPVLYHVRRRSDLTKTYSDSPGATNLLHALQDFTFSWDKSLTLSNYSLSQIEGEWIPSITTKNVGTSVSGGVVGLDSSGNIVVQYPDSSGFVSSYNYSSSGDLVPVWYDVSYSPPTLLTSLQDLRSSSLTFDAETGLYSYSAPDYSAILSSINQNVSDLSRKEVVIDNVRLELPDDFEINVPAPEVTVNPQVTVNPAVTVTPDVTVNVTAPTQNDITVAIDNSDILASLDALAVDIEANTYYTQTLDTTFGRDLDLSPKNLSSEEQSLLAIPQQWNTQIPLIGNAANVAFGAFLGNIPDPGRDLRPLNLQVLGFNMVIDFTPYSTYISWFRAFVLMAEFIWFLDCVWRSVVKVLSI